MGIATRLRLRRLFRPRAGSRAARVISRPPPELRPDISVSGLLDMGDLRQSTFRLRDTLGNDVQLDDVIDADYVAVLLGSTVTATGTPEYGTRGQLVSLSTTRVVSLAGQGWALPRMQDVDFTRAAPPVSGIDGVDDDDVAAFLRSIRE